MNPRLPLDWRDWGQPSKQGIASSRPKGTSLCQTKVGSTQWNIMSHNVLHIFSSKVDTAEAFGRFGTSYLHIGVICRETIIPKFPAKWRNSIIPESSEEGEKSACLLTFFFRILIEKVPKGLGFQDISEKRIINLNSLIKQSMQLWLNEAPSMRSFGFSREVGNKSTDYPTFIAWI